MALEANIKSESIVDIIADRTMATKIATKIVGKNSSVIILKTSAPLFPKTASGSCPSEVKYIRAKIPIVTAAASVNNVKAVATHFPLSISFSS